MSSSLREQKRGDHIGLMGTTVIVRQVVKAVDRRTYALTSICLWTYI